MQHDAPRDPLATPGVAAAAAHGGAAHGGAAHEPAHMKEYVRTIVSLALLTGVEFGLSFWMQSGFPRTLGIVLLVSMAAFKAWMVGRFFMHLKYDPRLLAFLVVLPVILAAPLIFLVAFDVKNGPIW